MNISLFGNWTKAYGGIFARLLTLKAIKLCSTYFVGDVGSIFPTTRQV